MPWADGTLLERLPVASFVLGLDHTVLLWNRACERLTGVPAETMRGTTKHAMPFYGEPRPVMADMVVSGASDADITALYGETWSRVGNDGTLTASAFCPALPPNGRWLVFSATPLYGADGALVGAVESCTDISETKQADLARQTSQRLLTEIVEGNPVPTIVIDADHRVTHWNRACEIVTGTPAASMLGTRDQWRAFYPEPRPVMADLVLDHAKRAEFSHYYKKLVPSPFIEGAYEAEAFFPHFPGGGRWLSFTAAPLRDLDGTVIGAIETLQDVTERKRAEAAFAESQRLIGEEKYRILFNEMINAIAVFNHVEQEPGGPADLCFVDVNPAFEDITGLKSEAIVTQSLRTVLPGLSQAEVDRIVAVAVTSVPDAFETYCADVGRYLDIRSFRPSAGQVALTFQDVSSRKEAEQRLQLLASVFDHTQEGILITDPDSVIVEVNDAFCRITGYAREDVLGATPRLLRSGKHGPDFYRAMWSSIRKDGLWSGEVWNRRKNGELFPEQLTISAVLDEHGQPAHYLGVIVDITAVKRHQAELDRIAHYDALTGLPNRVLLHDRMHQAISRAKRHKSLLAVCFLDVDGFKPVNDTLGHSAGDHLLIDLAERFRLELRENDTVARLGGDEFIILLADLHTQDDCNTILNRILSTVARPFDISGKRVSVSASIGVTLYPQNADDMDSLLRQADQAMYRSKQLGKNTFFFHDNMQDALVIAEQKKIRRTAQALANRELVLYYQPKVNMRTGQIVGAEALIRWKHPDMGLLPPSEFLPAIENHDLIVDLGDWVILEAARQLTTWESRGLNLTISINVSARHLQRADFAERLEQHLRNAGRLANPGLEMEITETAAINDLHHATTLIDASLKLGVRSALDDFGTGYSSLTYLKLLPVQSLKIDKSFILNMVDDQEDLAIVSGIVGLARAFNLSVIAEGVETTAHGLALLELGCDLAQGYGIARPMPADQLVDWVRTWRPDPSWGRVPEPVRPGSPALSSLCHTV